MAALYGDCKHRSTLVVPSLFKPPSSRGPSSTTESPSSSGPSSTTKSPSSSGPSSTTKSPSSRGPSSTTESPSSRGPSSTTESPSPKVASPTRAKTMAEPGSAIVQYTTIPALFQHIARATEEIITVHGIPSQEFTAFFEQREEQEDRRFLISLYTADTKCLIIMIPRGEHGGLHARLEDCFYADALSMGLGTEFDPVRSTTFMTRDANGNITSAGEGDSSRKPISMRPKYSQYPTLVIEAGWSQSLQKLQEKARWWFDKSNGDVKIVLLAKASPGSNLIRIEKWKLAPAPSRRGATTTRAASAPTSQCVHFVEIARATGINNAHPDRFKPASYVVTGGPLQLEFIDIFLRQPIPPGERDLIIGNPALQRYAAVFWEGMN